MRQQLDKQLNRLHVELIKMGSLCEKAISLSAKLLVQRSDSIMREVFAVDSEIDTKEKELESFCMMLLLQQQPVAKDFREVSAALKMGLGLGTDRRSGGRHRRSVPLYKRRDRPWTAAYQ